MIYAESHESNRLSSHEIEIGNQDKTSIVCREWNLNTGKRELSLDGGRGNKRASNGLLSDLAACLIYVNTLIKLFYVLLTEDY
jgi:hypothetical protein